MKAAPYKRVQDQRWDKLAALSPDASVLHRRWFNDLLVDCWHEPDCSQVVMDGQEVVAILPLQHRLFCNELHSPGRGFAGPALHPGLDQAGRRSALELLASAATRVAARLGATGVRMSPATVSRSFRAGSSPQLPGSIIEQRHSVRQIDLARPWSDVESGFRKTTRHELRKAEKAGVTIRLLTPSGATVAYYPMHQETYARTGATPHPAAYFAGIWRHAIAGGQCRVLCASLRGEDVAVLNIGIDHGAAWYWTGAATKAGLECRAGHLLQAYAMQALHAEGFELYDLGPLATEATEGKLRGLFTFKTGFGGDDVMVEECLLPVPGSARLLGRVRRKILRVAGRSRP